MRGVCFPRRSAAATRAQRCYRPSQRLTSRGIRAMLSLLTITRGTIDAAGALRSASVVQEHLGAELLVAHPDPVTAMAVAAAGPEGIMAGIDLAAVKAES